MSKPVIDLTRFHFMRELGDLVLIGTWVWNEDREDTEPCLVLLPRYRPPSSVKPCIIALSSAWKYNDAKYCVGAAKGMAFALGFEDSMSTTHRIADIIHSHLPDLVSMPVDPQTAEVVGTASVDVGGGKRRTVEFLDHVQVQQI
ncbi:hypothetical protein UFOVP275_40 [uncultured Caudovirales phage]|uniref:Uncharacterized protein n=1 Tax=uncultured Caudovirales phage TaxID=2100421 RepID=A0A6J5LK50_9CAUD|nr:hypothetical protein UFOVP275_40 [uncultured Caudovirales phage]